MFVYLQEWRLGEEELRIMLENLRKCSRNKEPIEISVGKNKVTIPYDSPIQDYIKKLLD